MRIKAADDKGKYFRNYVTIFLIMGVWGLAEKWVGVAENPQSGVGARGSSVKKGLA
jgi:hypothetical protein